MALTGWIIDKSAAARKRDTLIGRQLAELRDQIFICPMGALEQLYSARSAADYDGLREELYAGYETVSAPDDILERTLRLQRDLAHHQGMWHRTAIPDLIIAETALHHDLGVLHVDQDYERIAAVRPLRVRRLG